MKRTSKRLSVGAFAALAALLVGTSTQSEAFAFTTLSPRLLSRNSISRALSPRKVLTRRSGPSRSKDRTCTLLFSTAAPERVVTKTEQQVATQQEEDIPNNMPDALNRFFLGPDRGPVCVLGMLAFISAWRLSIAAITSVDLAALVGMVLFWCFQEHFIHEKLLHSTRNWMGKEIHQNHHAKPYFNISIDPAWLMISWLATAHALFRFALPLPLALSATLGYASAGLFYEWAHFFVHTRVRPPNAFWKQVRDNHIRHHLVDDRYWLSFTLPIVDDIFGTNPSVEDVKRDTY